jgi:hypothetical protein
MARKVLAVTYALLTTVLAFGYVTDSKIYPPPPDYATTQNPPRVGKKFVDVNFHSPSSPPDWIWRITNARNTPRADGEPGYLTLITHEYATTSPFNSDRTKLLLIHQTHFALYNGEGKFIRSLLQVCPTCSPRWSRTNPDVFFYVRGRQFYEYDTSVDAEQPLGLPLNYDAIITRGEDDICFDGDHLVGFGRRGAEYYMYVFSVSRAEVVAEQLIGDAAAFTNVDAATVAPDDIVVVSYIANDRFGQGLPGTGMWAFDLALNPLHQLTTAIGHADVGRDDDGSPVLVWANAGSYQPLAGCPNGLEKISINEPANRQCLLSLHWTLAMHASLPDQSGWVFVSTHAPGDPIYGALSRKEEASPMMRFSPGWNLEQNSRFSWKKALWSETASSSVSFVFYGTTVQWVGLKDYRSGIARVTLDGLSENIDLYSPERMRQAVVYSRSGLAEGWHTLSVTVTGTRNPASSGYRVYVDAMEDNTPWTVYTNEILKVKLDGSEVRRLAHHRSRAWNTYTYQPKVSVCSRDGKRIVFTSNYGVLSRQYTNYSDEYMMEVN